MAAQKAPVGRPGLSQIRSGRGGTALRLIVKEQREQEDYRDWDTQQPKKNTSTHDALLLFVVACQRVTRLSVPC